MLLGMDMNAALMGIGGMILAAAHVVTSGYCSFASINFSESNLAFASVLKVTFLRPSPAFAVQSSRVFAIKCTGSVTSAGLRCSILALL